MRNKLFILTYLALCFIVLPSDMCLANNMPATQPKATAENTDYLLLIVGCGRSGTGYISTLLRECGLDIGHEVLGVDGTSNWFWTFDSSINCKYHYKHIFHQIRNPLDVISSWYNNEIDHSYIWIFICSHVPEIDSNEPFLVRCAKYWYYWNLAAEKKAEWSYRVEDIDAVISEFQSRLQVPLQVEKLQMVTKDYNHWQPIKNKITWQQLKMALSEEDFTNVQLLALKYGYAIED